MERLRAGRLRRALRVALPADHPPLPLVVGLMLAVASANASTLSEPPRGVGGNVQSARSPSSPLGDANFAGSSSRGGMDDNPSTFGRRDTLNRPLAPNPKSVLRHNAWPVPTGARFLCSAAASPAAAPSAASTTRLLATLLVSCASSSLRTASSASASSVDTASRCSNTRRLDPGARKLPTRGGALSILRELPERCWRVAGFSLATARGVAAKS